MKLGSLRFVSSMGKEDTTFLRLSNLTANNQNDDRDVRDGVPDAGVLSGEHGGCWTPDRDDADHRCARSAMRSTDVWFNLEGYWRVQGCWVYRW
jgi:hypothetical protein